MNIYDAILRDDPVAAYLFGTTPAATFPNLMGGSAVMTVSGGTGNAPIYPGSMVSGPGNSLIIGNGFQAQMTATNRFNTNYNKMPFSIEGFYKFVDVNATVVPLGSHTGSTDGLTFDGNNINFRIDLVGGTNVTVSWPVPNFVRDYHVVGTYNGSRISLYINGVLVASAEIPDGSVLASKASDVLYAGATGTNKTLYEAPAFYDSELSATDVSNHYIAARQNIPASEAVAAYGGRIFKFRDDERDVLFKDAVDWRTEGIGDNVAASDYLRPTYDASDLSQAGTFTYAVQAADLDSASNYQGMKLEWNGDGNFTVQYSINNGSTWSTAVNNAVQANTVGLSQTIPPLIRITFAAGRAKGLDVVRDMTATVYSSLNVRAVNDSERRIVMGSAGNTSSYWYEPIDMDTSSGTTVNNTSMVLQESTDAGATNIGTVSMWVRIVAGGGGYLFDGRSVTPSNAGYLSLSAANALTFPAGVFSAVYVNGVAVTSGSFTMVVDRFYHVVTVWTTAFNSKLDFNSGGAAYKVQYNTLTYFENKLTSSQVSALYSSFFGNPVLAIVDPNTVTISETAPAAKAYVNDWSISAAG